MPRSKCTYGQAREFYRNYVIYSWCSSELLFTMCVCRIIYKLCITSNFLQNYIFYKYASLQGENKTCLPDSW